MRNNHTSQCITKDDVIRKENADWLDALRASYVPRRRRRPELWSTEAEASGGMIYGGGGGGVKPY